MIAVYISILPFICYADSTRLGLSSDHDTLSSSSRRTAVDGYMFDTSKLFSPLTDMKSVENQKTYQRNNFEKLKSSEIFQNDIKEKVRREAYITNELIIHSELLKAKGVHEVDDGVGDEDSLIGDSLRTQTINLQSMETKNIDLSSNFRHRKGTPKDTETGDVTDGYIVV